jgi:protein O-mannosyl-transferase
MATQREKPAVSLTRMKLYFVCFMLVASTAIGYWKVDRCGFIDFDDPYYVYKNYHLSSGTAGARLSWAFTTYYAANWHPLTWLSHMVDYRLYGLRPAGHHLSSLVFHIINALLLFFLLRAMTRSLWKSAFVAALFALHPLHVESVAWVSERKDVLSTFFMFASLLWYTSYVRTMKKRAYWAALVSFACGLMAKPMVVTLPFIMLLMDFWPFSRLCPVVGEIEASSKNRFLSLLVEKIPFFFLSILSCVITVIAQRAGNAIVKASELTFSFRIENSLVAYLSYIEKTLWPANLCFFYPIFPHSQPLARLVAAVAVLMVISGIAIVWRKKKPYLLMGWLWFLGTLVPVIGIVQVGSQALADRYTYVPLVGLFIMAAWALSALSAQRRAGRIAAIAVSVAVLVVLTMQTRVQAGYWRNDLVLANHCLAVTGDNFCAYSVKGSYLLKANELDSALACYTKSFSLCPADMTSRLDIGTILLKQGKLLQSKAIFCDVLSQEPDNELAMLNCGKAMALLGEKDSAVIWFTKAILLDPVLAPALYNLGTVYAEMKNYALSRQYFERAVRITPNDLDACFALGNACFLGGHKREAIQWYEKSVAINPYFVIGFRRLAMALDSCGMKDEAHTRNVHADSLEALFAAHK